VADEEKWERTNALATTRGYTEGMPLGSWMKQCMRNDSICCLEKGELVILCHRDDVVEVEKDLGIERDIFAEKVEWVIAWLVRRGAGDSMSCATAAKDLIAAGFEAGYKPELVAPAPKPRVKISTNRIVLDAIDIVESLRHLMNEQQLARLAELKSLRQ